MIMTTHTPTTKPSALSKDFLTSLRQRFLFQHIPSGLNALEIGAYARPTLTAPEFHPTFLDFYSTSELQDQCLKTGGDPDAIVPVEYVVKGEDYRNFVKKQFDIVVACHVLEHIANPVKWLNMVGDLTSEGGYLFVALPDRRAGFDKLRDETSLSHILCDYFLKDRDLVSEHAVETYIYYDREYIKRPRSIEESLSVDKIVHAAGMHHAGLHCHVFSAATFLGKILKPLTYMKLIPWSAVAVSDDCRGGEFYALLKKEASGTSLTNEEFFQALEESHK